MPPCSTIPVYLWMLICILVNPDLRFKRCLIEVQLSTFSYRVLQWNDCLVVMGADMKTFFFERVNGLCVYFSAV